MKAIIIGKYGTYFIKNKKLDGGRVMMVSVNKDLDFFAFEVHANTR